MHRARGKLATRRRRVIEGAGSPAPSSPLAWACPFASPQEFCSIRPSRQLASGLIPPHRSFTALAQTDHPPWHDRPAVPRSPRPRSAAAGIPCYQHQARLAAERPRQAGQLTLTADKTHRPGHPPSPPARPGPVNPSPTARIASQIPRRCQLRPGQSRPTRRHGPEDHVREAVPRNAGAAPRPVQASNGSPAGSRRTRPVILGTRTCSPARQIAGSVWPEQPPGTRPSAHRTADLAPPPQDCRSRSAVGRAQTHRAAADGRRGDARAFMACSLAPDTTYLIAEECDRRCSAQAW